MFHQSLSSARIQLFLAYLFSKNGVNEGRSIRKINLIWRKSRGRDGSQLKPYRGPLWKLYSKPTRKKAVLFGFKDLSRGKELIPNSNLAGAEIWTFFLFNTVKCQLSVILKKFDITPCHFYFTSGLLFKTNRRWHGSIWNKVRRWCQL